MAAEMSRMDVVGQNGKDGLHYCEELDWHRTGDVGDEQHHVGGNASETPNSSNHIVETNEKVEPYRPTPGIECEARTPRDNQWPKWTPVVVRAYDGNEVWFRCLITNESFSGPIDRIEFRPKPELIPLSKGGELNQASWDDFVSRLRHDCVGEGVHRHYTAEAIFIVQKRDIIYGIDSDYTDNFAILVDDSAYHSIQEYWDALDEPECVALNVASQEEEECDFLEMNQRYQLDLLSELDNHTITGWGERWEYVNSHFTHDAAEAFIQRKKHDYPKGLRVYTDAQIYCWEYNTIKEAILSGKLKFVDADIQSNG